MPLWYWFIGVVGAIALVVFVIVPLVVRYRNHGRLMRCPDCGTTFQPPYMDTKGMGFGAMIPYMGYIACPSCKERHRRRDFALVPKDKA